MSATRFRSPAHTAASAVVPEQQSPARLRLLWLVAFVALAWPMALLLMALATANPLVVSRDQILKADAVVIARRVRAGDEFVRVDRVFRGNIAVGDELRVLNLAGLPGLGEDRPYLLALSQFRHDYVITTLEGQRAAPLVYETSPETIQAVKSILPDRL